MQQVKNENGRVLWMENAFRGNSQTSKKGYLLLCEVFAFLWVEQFEKERGKLGDIVGVSFSKQDMRACPSITLFNKAHCVPYQRHFRTYGEMEQYIRGYLSARTSI
jgi:hypothetical protein